MIHIKAGITGTVLGASWLAATAPVIDEKSLVPIGAAVVIGSAIAGLIWKTSSWKRDIEHEQTQTKQDIAELKELLTGSIYERRADMAELKADIRQMKADRHKH